jgi:hypothetical protein
MSVQSAAVSRLPLYLNREERATEFGPTVPRSSAVRPTVARPPAAMGPRLPPPLRPARHRALSPPPAQAPPMNPPALAARRAPARPAPIPPALPGAEHPLPRPRCPRARPARPKLVRCAQWLNASPEFRNPLPAPVKLPSLIPAVENPPYPKTVLTADVPHKTHDHEI